MTQTNQTVQKNLERMLGSEPGDMGFLISRESIGGNAGVLGGVYPCVMVNFYYDGETGEITYFENPQNTPLEIVERCKEGGFKLAVNTLNLLEKNKKPYRIVRRYTQYNSSQTARTVLEQTEKVYNERHGFPDHNESTKRGKEEARR